MHHSPTHSPEAQRLQAGSKLRDGRRHACKAVLLCGVVVRVHACQRIAVLRRQPVPAAIRRAGSDSSGSKESGGQHRGRQPGFVNSSSSHIGHVIRPGNAHTVRCILPKLSHVGQAVHGRRAGELRQHGAAAAATALLPARLPLLAQRHMRPGALQLHLKGQVGVRERWGRNAPGGRQMRPAHLTCRAAPAVVTPPRAAGAVGQERSACETPCCNPTARPHGRGAVVRCHRLHGEYRNSKAHWVCCPAGYHVGTLPMMSSWSDLAPASEWKTSAAPLELEERSTNRLDTVAAAMAHAPSWRSCGLPAACAGSPHSQHIGTAQAPPAIRSRQVRLQAPVCWRRRSRRHR